jgi:hypothetical protein
LVLDQEQSVYDEDMAISIGAGIEQVGQKFTADITGTLKEIDMAFSGDVAVGGLVRIYQLYTGSGLVEMGSFEVTVSSDGAGPNYNSFVVDAPVESGNNYVFLLEPVGESLPDPYAVCVGLSDPYAGGYMAWVENGDYWGPIDRDLVFRTWVEPIPDPGTVVLLGLGALAAARRRKRRDV